MTRRLLATLALALLTLSGVGVAASSAATATPSDAVTGASSGASTTGNPVVDRLVVIGTGGLSWSDISPEKTPELWAMLDQGSGSALVARSVFTNTCPVDGWLGLSAGNRAAATLPDGAARPTTEPCPALPEPARDGTIENWSAYTDAASKAAFDARPGLLATLLTEHDVEVTAIGPGAALAGTQEDGTPAGSYQTLERALTDDTAFAHPGLTLVDIGQVRDPELVADGEDVTGLGSRAAQVAAIDASLGEVRSAVGGDVNVILTSPSDSGRTERLRVLAAVGPDFSAGTLMSPSTRQDSLAQASDVTVTTLQLFDVPVPKGVGGGLLTTKPADDDTTTEDRHQHLTDVEVSTSAIDPLVPPFFNGFAYSQILVYAFVWLVWKGKLGSVLTRTRLLGVTRVVGTLAASVPISTFLANLLPWWRTETAMLGLIGAVGLFAVLITAVALLGPWRRAPLGSAAVVALATVGVLAVDVMTGSELILTSVMGLHPLDGGRFYGFGNVPFAIFATATIFLMIAASDVLVRRGHVRLGAAAALGIGLLASLIDGNPQWGADGGGPLALLPATAYLVLTILGVRITWRRGLVIALATAAVFLGVCFLDWLRPAAERSHLGNFLQEILDGGALQIILRKANTNLSILFGNYRLTLLVPIALIFVIYVLARPTSWGSRALQAASGRHPTLRPGLVALVVMLALGFALNDSGTAIPAVGATVAVPLLIAINVKVLIDQIREHRARELAQSTA
ncbi:hypothetical protein [Janibacter sp. G1551]|uniref:hypothetical protein n=1 Tax=Janibacter sp. G1551 TaxID=3420440 RepID=UPI003CFC98B1